MKKMVWLTAVVIATVCGGCNNVDRVFDSEIAAIRDQTRVLEKIERHLAVIATKVK